MAVKPTTRIVEVSAQFYAQLMEYLLIDERWMKSLPEDRMGLTLYVQDFADGSTRELVFTREVERWL